VSRSVGKWKLPQPTDIKEENKWVSIPRIARSIPFGYKIDENDSAILNPIPEQLDLLEKARQHTKQYSFRQVANWLTKNTGRQISHVGLRKRLMHEKQRKNKIKSISIWAEYAKKAIQKAEELANQRTGAKRESINT